MSISKDVHQMCKALAMHAALMRPIDRDVERDAYMYLNLIEDYVIQEDLTEIPSFGSYVPPPVVSGPQVSAPLAPQES